MALLPLALLQSACGSSEGAGSSAEAATAIPDRALTASLEAHQNMLTYNVINLSTWANRLRRMVEADNREKAIAAYLHAREWLGRIEPALAAMPEVSDPLLDPASGGGFPRIEEELGAGHLRQLRPIMKGFHRKMERLRVRVEHANLEPEQVPTLAIGALRSLESANPGATRFPTVPAIEAAARLEGVKALAVALSPALEEAPALRDKIKQAFVGIFRTLRERERETARLERSLSDEREELIQLFEDASRVRRQ